LGVLTDAIDPWLLGWDVWFKPYNRIAVPGDYVIILLLIVCDVHDIHRLIPGGIFSAGKPYFSDAVTKDLSLILVSRKSRIELDTGS
jgi:hypothetical protein